MIWAINKVAEALRFHLVKPVSELREAWVQVIEICIDIFFNVFVFVQVSLKQFERANSEPIEKGDNGRGEIYLFLENITEFLKWIYKTSFIYLLYISINADKVQDKKSRYQACWQKASFRHKIFWSIQPLFFADLICIFLFYMVVDLFACRIIINEISNRILATGSIAD